MRNTLVILVATALGSAAICLHAQGGRGGAAPMGPVQGDRFRTQYVRLGQDGEGLLYEPTVQPAKARLALVYSHPMANNFNAPFGREMASRGYRMLLVNYRGPDFDPEAMPEAYLPSVSRGITYLRGLPGVQRVVVLGHSGGAELAALYENVAEHGASACQGQEKIYPCRGDALAGLQKPDGLILLDIPLAAFHRMSGVDPSVDGRSRNPALDMFAAANGYDPSSGRAIYSPDFTKRFNAAQSARNTEIVDHALERLRILEQGSGEFADDEPLTIRGMGVNAAGARLYEPDTTIAAHTKKPRLLLRANGTEAEAIVQSVRPPAGQQSAEGIRKLNVMNLNTTVRHFLASYAIRTGSDYAITADDITGVDWSSAYTSPPANAQGVSVPALVMAMSCHYLIVPSEITFEHLGSKDKSFAIVEGATHGFSPCRPEYGDTVKRTFDFVDEWLSKPGRF